MRKYTFIIFLCLPQISFAQNNKQKISGVITDKLLQSTLPGAAVQIISTADKKGTTSDSNGNYVVSDVSPERYELKITYLGYKDVLVSNIIVTSGKETILDIEMEEKVTDLNEVVVTANSKEKTINNLIPGLEATTEGPINKKKVRRIWWDTATLWLALPKQWASILAQPLCPLTRICRLI